MATVTALRERHGLVAIELDGGPWRTVPVAAAAEARLTVGCALDRERAADARPRAPQASRARRCGSRRGASRPLARDARRPPASAAGVRETERDRDDRGGRACGARRRRTLRGGAGAAARLARCGRPARARRPRAERRRRRHGPRRRCRRSSPSTARAARIVASRGVSERTLRYLASRGFSEESLERPRCRSREPGARMRMLHPTFPCTRVRSEPVEPSDPRVDNRPLEPAAAQRASAGGRAGLEPRTSGAGSPHEVGERRM